MGNMRIFKAQKRYAGMKSEGTTPTQVGFFVRDFIDWYHDNLRGAPHRSGKKWMTAYSALPHSTFRHAIQRGVGGYLRARDTFPNFREATDFTQMTLMNSLVLPMPVINPPDKLALRDSLTVAMKRKVKTPEVFRVFEDAADISFVGLAPGSYYLKSNHGSKQLFRVDVDGVNEPANINQLRREAALWLEEAYGTASSQWWYRLIDRKVFIEEDLKDTPDTVLPDLKFHCINGEPVLLQHSTGIGTEARDDAIYDKNLNYLPYPFLRQNRVEAELPELAGKALEVAREFCRDHQYLRVDLYIRGGSLYLGELTWLPNSGRRAIQSPELNEYLCSHWDPMPQVVAIK